MKNYGVKGVSKKEALTRLRNDSVMELTVNEVNVAALTKKQISGVVDPAGSSNLQVQLDNFKKIVSNIKERIEMIDDLLFQEIEKDKKNEKN